MKANPKRSPTIETSTLPDGHAVLVSKITEWAYTLSPVGALVWEFCDGSHSVDDIVATIRAIPEFSATPPVKEEITSLIVELEESGFFED